MINEIESVRNADVKRRVHEGLDMIMDRAEGMRENSKEMMNNLKERAIIMRENVDDFISKNQEKSVLIASGVGFAVGAVLVALMMRRRK